MRPLILAAAIALAPVAAQAQFATIGPTPPVTDNGDRLATTAWVNNLIANGLTLASGKVWIGSAGNIATAQTPSGDCTLSLSGVITCTQAAGNFAVIGNLSVGGAIIDANGILATNIAAPATPAAGTTRIYVDSTTKALTFKNDAGTVGNAVVPSTAVATQYMTGISAAGLITRAQPAFSDLSGQGTCAQEPAMTGDVTSSAGTCALAIGANKVTRAMEAQGVARSVVGVTGNATANVADIQGSANQALVVNSAGTALAFGQVNLASSSAVTGTLPVANGGTGDTGTAWSAYTPSAVCGTATFTVNSAKSKTMGKTTWAQADITISAIGTCVGVLTFTLPNTAASSGALVGAEIGVSNNNMACRAAAASATATCLMQGGAAYSVNARVMVSGVYENQ